MAKSFGVIHASKDRLAHKPLPPTCFILVLLQLCGPLSYVVVVALDFSEAFDTVRHSSAMAKVAQLQIPDCVHNWLTDFLDGHSHCTWFNGYTSDLLPVNASFVQGSAIGPVMYVVNAGDL